MPGWELLAGCQTNRKAFKALIPKIWRTNQEVTVELVCDNIFAFHFQNIQDKKRVLSEGPWNFDNSLLVLKEPQEVGLVKDHKYGLWLRTTSPPKERFSRSGRQSGQGTFANFATSRKAATSDSRNNGTNRVMLPNELSQERVEQSKSIGKDNIVSVPIEDSSFPLVFLQKRIIRGCIQSLGKWTREVRMICQTDVQVI
ncbi:hypothetical protein JRO89_XS10G0167500 [Xanthoceras sorbifolium]|uniref:DUF4283 domain-containing protein n=1 Tax=Xanthoceras sorbifolium TaxID=99658 RepID=A0ABQ8HJ20_9ROSI|nr:hypothetical protein JRO89_XS10G0167500 [Xanthoceras sorbifolium]